MSVKSLFNLIETGKISILTQRKSIAVNLHCLMAEPPNTTSMLHCFNTSRIQYFLQSIDTLSSLLALCAFRSILLLPVNNSFYSDLDHPVRCQFSNDLTFLILLPLYIGFTFFVHGHFSTTSFP